MKISYLPLVVALSMSTTGCWLGNQSKVKVPSAPSVTPSSAPQQSPSASEGTAAVTAPSAPAATPAVQPPASAESSGAPASPPGATPTPKPPVARTNPTPAQPSPPPGPAASPMPQLAEILTADQRRQYQAEFAQDVARSNAALKQAGGHNLTAPQRETVTRIRTFLNQAAAARYNDLATAVQLSRRADLLAQELLKGLK
jgi:hypothetical protein